MDNVPDILDDNAVMRLNKNELRSIVRSYRFLLLSAQLDISAIIAAEQDALRYARLKLTP